MSTQSTAKNSILGQTVAVRDGDGSSVTVRHGTLLEIKRSRGNDAASIRDLSAPMALWCYVRFPDTDHRCGQWLPATLIDLSSSGQNWGVGINHVEVSSVSTEITPSMLRQRESGTLMDFLEERLLRDVRTPPSLRYMVYLDKFVFQSWYFTPCGALYPEFSPLNPELHDCYLCPYTWSMFSSQHQLERHVLKAGYNGLTIPEAREVYRDDNAGISLLEVSGSRSSTFCRNLVLVGKAFLENKLAGHDVHLYYFYVVCLHQNKLLAKSGGVSNNCGFPFQIPSAEASVSSSKLSPMIIAGFFSWEKGVEAYNLACIVTLPCFQSSGIGSFLITASYELAYRRGHIGTPERPLSDLGRSAYLSYWRRSIVKALLRLQTDLVGPFDMSESLLLQEQTQPATQQQRLLVTPQDLAVQCKLDVNDVMETITTLGLVHHLSEQRTRLLVIPQSWLAREADTMKRKQNACYIFDAAHFLMKKRDRSDVK